MKSVRTVGVVGIGYVGLVTAVALAELGYEVTCLDVDVEKLDRLARGISPFHEPGLDAELHRLSDRLRFTADPVVLYAAADIVFVAVDTPPMPTGDADLTRVFSVINSIPAGYRGLLVMKSTVPVGTGARIQLRLRQRHLQVSYVSNPEFLREGSALADVFAPDRVVVGADDPDAAASVAAVWAPLKAESVCCDLASAEMIKLAANAFLATKISFVNEIANVCDVVGADVSVVARGMGLDRRIGPAFLNPGIGYGGSCFPKDVVALKQLAGNRGYHFQLLSSVIEVNNLQGRRLIGTLKSLIGSLTNRRVALLGLSFKPGTDDVRGAPSLVLAARLIAEGASVIAHDPIVVGSAALPDGVEIAGSLAEALRGADAALIVTEWPDYLAVATPAMRDLMNRPLVLDGRNLLDPVVAAEAGLEWVGIGRPSTQPRLSCSPAA